MVDLPKAPVKVLWWGAHGGRRSWTAVVDEPLTGL